MKVITSACVDVIKEVLEKYKINGALFFCLNETCYNAEHVTAESALLPNMIFWDPLSLIDESVKLRCQHCFDDSKVNFPLKQHKSWTLGQNNAMNPRRIWDHGWSCIIIGRLYTCGKNHRIISYHASVLQQLPVSDVPFILTHDTGYTNRLSNFILRNVESGKSFCAIHTILKQSALEKYTHRTLHMKNHKDFPKQDISKATSPATVTVMNCFLLNYEKHKELYKKHFKNIAFTSLSMVYTYNDALNISIVENRKWLKLYDSLFLILTETGFVKGFQFTKGESFEDVRDLLSELAEENPEPEYLFVENCCSDKSALKKIFPNAKIKLNPFHAVKRLSQYMSEKHPFHSEAVKSVESVFCAKGDELEYRKLPTPSIDILSKNMQEIIKRLENVDSSRWKIMPFKVLDEFEKLSEHVHSGCLSDIPPVSGVEQNKELIELLIPIKGKITIKSAVPIITQLLYAYNTKKSGTKEVLPIWSQFISKQSSQKSSEVSSNETAHVDFEVEASKGAADQLSTTGMAILLKI